LIPYCELHARSAFSFLEGASLPEDLAEQAVTLGLPAMALIDAHGLYGAPRFFKAAQRTGLRALVGAEIALADDFPRRDSSRASSTGSPYTRRVSGRPADRHFL
jgi:DNA polymerase III alpha subunit